MSWKRWRLPLSVAILAAALLGPGAGAAPTPTPKAGTTPGPAGTPPADGTPAAEATPEAEARVSGPAHGSRAALLALGGPTQAAEAILLDAQNKPVGTVTLVEQIGHLFLHAEVERQTPGEHGFHIHAVGSCEPPDFQSAGAHFAPMQNHHGLQSPDGYHAGDLPNLVVGEDGTGTFDAVTDRMTLAEGPWSLFDKDGSAIVLHAKPDDYKTYPAGNSGDRVACGIVKVSGTKSAARARAAAQANADAEPGPTSPPDASPAPGSTPPAAPPADATPGTPAPPGSTPRSGARPTRTPRP